MIPDVYGQQASNEFSVAGDQFWYFGVISLGEKMPLADAFNADMNGDVYGNQLQPLILSDQGDVIWSEYPYRISYAKKNLVVLSDSSKIIKSKAGSSLKQSFLFARKNYFAKTDSLPDSDFFLEPQYNTWIELTYDQNQEDILKYAHAIIDNGLPPGILMIDDTWQQDYGVWDFNPARFNDPRGMMNELHQLGFKIMLWICPFVSPDSAVYRKLNEESAFLMTKGIEKDRDSLNREDIENRNALMVHWWNGVSAVLDLSNPVAIKWFKGRLDYLQNEYGIDGFKFDAGDASYYVGGESYGNVSANDQTELFGKIGLDYPLNEYRAMWKMGGQPLVERLRDKEHSWEDLQKLIPQMALAGLMGYPYSCPDMIGGGQFTSFSQGAKIDEELIVRSAQSHVLMPMMQFSVAPWRILDETHFGAVKKAVAIRQKFSKYILEMAKVTARTGEPILRPLEYDFPHQGYAMIKDEFLLGEKILVAPVLEKGATARTVIIPKGNWKSFQGKKIKGPKTIKIQVGLDDLPYFEKTNP